MAPDLQIQLFPSEGARTQPLSVQSLVRNGPWDQELTFTCAASFSSFLRHGVGVDGAGWLSKGGRDSSVSVYSVHTVLFCGVKEALNSCPPEHFPLHPACRTAFTILDMVLTWPCMIAEVIQVSLLQTHCLLQFLEHFSRPSFQPE